MIPITLLALQTLDPTPGDHKVRAVVEEVVQVLANGNVRAWDMQGKAVPNAKDPRNERPGERLLAKAGENVYRIVLKIFAEPGFPTFGRSYIEDARHDRIEVSQIYGSGDSKGIHEILTFSLPADQSDTVLHCKVADGPFSKFLDETIDDDHRGGVARLEHAGGGSARGPMDVFEYNLSPSDLGVWEARGTAKFSDGTTSTSLMPTFHFDPSTHEVSNEALWFSGAKGAKIMHLTLKRRRYQVLGVGPIPLRPK